MLNNRDLPCCGVIVILNSAIVEGGGGLKN